MATFISSIDLAQWQHLSHEAKAEIETNYAHQKTAQRYLAAIKN